MHSNRRPLECTFISCIFFPLWLSRVFTSRQGRKCVRWRCFQILVTGKCVSRTPDRTHDPFFRSVNPSNRFWAKMVMWCQRFRFDNNLNRTEAKKKRCTHHITKINEYRWKVLYSNIINKCGSCRCKKSIGCARIVPNFQGRTMYHWSINKNNNTIMIKHYCLSFCITLPMDVRWKAWTFD